MNTLEQAADLLEQGWCQRNLIQDGKYCAVGAIAAIEMDIDMRILERPSANPWSLEYIQERNDVEKLIYETLDKSEAVAALVEEIKETEWFRNLAEPNRLGFKPTEIVYFYNDSNVKYDVLETFKYAAKRLDA